MLNVYLPGPWGWQMRNWTPLSQRARLHRPPDQKQRIPCSCSLRRQTLQSHPCVHLSTCLHTAKVISKVDLKCTHTLHGTHYLEVVIRSIATTSNFLNVGTFNCPAQTHWTEDSHPSPYPSTHKLHAVPDTRETPSRVATYSLPWPQSQHRCMPHGRASCCCSTPLHTCPRLCTCRCQYRCESHWTNHLLEQYGQEEGKRKKRRYGRRREGTREGDWWEKGTNGRSGGRVEEEDGRKRWGGKERGRGGMR